MGDDTRNILMMQALCVAAVAPAQHKIGTDQTHDLLSHACIQKGGKHNGLQAMVPTLPTKQDQHNQVAYPDLLLQVGRRRKAQ